MGKINFTQENQKRLEELAIKFLFNNLPVQGPLGSILRIDDLIHNTTINTLVSINSHLKKKISELEDIDEWTATEGDRWKLSRAKENQELVNLLIGYKRYAEELEEIETKKTELMHKIAELKDSQKTPAEKIAELEKELSTL
jgi:chromosome segregation ATPase